MDANWVVLLASVALLVRAGQMLGAMGIARAKNVASAGLRSLAELCVATLCFWAFGAAIAFHTANPVFGVHADYLIGWHGFSNSWFPTLVLALIASSMVAPAVSERSKLRVPLVFGGLVAGLIVPIVIHWVQRGWLLNLQFIDAGGAGAIHLAPAICAAFAALFVGPRDGKYNRDGSSNMIPGHSVLMILMSVVLMVVGWVPYFLVAAPAALGTHVAANAIVAMAAGGLSALCFGHVRFGKVDVLLTCSGILGGLVAITAGAVHVHSSAAFIIGAVAGIIIPYATIMLDLRLKLDDPGAVVAIHGVGAVWSLLAAAIFLPMETVSIADRFKHLGVQLLGIVAISITAGMLAILTIAFLRMAGSMRSREADEYDGLDLADHDVNAHPDFQQTMIKSYHLREA